MDNLAIFVLGWLLAIAGGQTTLHDLTVPADRLPAGCTLPSSPASTDAQGVHGGLWANLPIDGNPWIGAEPVVVATLRERAEPPRRVVDGPPLSKPEAARARLRLAEGVEQAYAAVYADASHRLVVVYGLKLAGRAEIQTAIVGSASACYDAVRGHVGGLR
jgi:hypothetical protein